MSKTNSDDKIRTVLALALWRIENGESAINSLSDKETEFQAALPRLSPAVTQIIGILASKNISLQLDE